MITPFSDLGKERQNPFLDTRIRIRIFPKKRTLSFPKRLKSLTSMATARTRKSSSILFARNNEFPSVAGPPAKETEFLSYRRTSEVRSCAVSTIIGLLRYFFFRQKLQLLNKNRFQSTAHASHLFSWTHSFHRLTFSRPNNIVHTS